MNTTARACRRILPIAKTARLVPVLILLALSAISVGAHGYIVRAIPADRSSLERPPTRLQYWFSEDLEPRFSEINLRDQSGSIITSGGVDAQNQALLSLRVPTGLDDGAYIVELRPAFASDGHVIAESRVFFVGEEVGGVAGEAAGDRAIPLEALWRALLNLAHFLFFGASSLYTVVLIPAWGGARHGGGGLPPRVIRRVRNCLIFSLPLALTANLIALLQQSMVFFNADAAQVIQQGLWQVVLIGSRFGDIWTFRLVLLLFCAVLLFAAEYFRDLMPQLAGGVWRGLPWLGALFIGMSMVTGHAAGSTLLPWVAIAVDWLHALAAAFWLGGALTLTLLLPVALAPYDADQKRQALRAVLLRFSRMMLPLVALLIVSGIYNALNFIITPAELGTGYGRTLAVKALIALPVFILGAQQHLALRPQIARRLQSTLANIPLAGRFLPAGRNASGAILRIEVLLMLATLIAVAWLSATPIPEPNLPRSDIEAPQATLTVGDVTITSAVIPGGPGVNSYDTVISSEGSPAAGLQVALQLVNPERGIRSRWLTTEEVETGLYATAGDDIDRAGNWWTLIDVVQPEGNSTRAAFIWDIDQATAVQQSRPPQLIHILVLLAIGTVLAVWLYPRARCLLTRLKLTPASLIIAASAVAVSLGIMAAGAILINEQQRNYELTLNPSPTVINTVLPDAESLRRGEALYREHCLVWQGQSADFRALRNRLDSVRDDFLYETVAKGWRDLPPCGSDLSVGERWDVVNYFRTFEQREP